MVNMIRVGLSLNSPASVITLWYNTTQRFLYFDSPRERPWRQRVFWRKTLVIACATYVFSHTFKKKHWDWRIKDASCSVCRWARSMTSTVVLGMRQNNVQSIPPFFGSYYNSKMDTYHAWLWKAPCLVLITSLHINIDSHQKARLWVVKIVG